MEHGKKQDHDPGLQESRLEPLQLSAWKCSVTYSPGTLERRGIQENLVFKDQSVQTLKFPPQQGGKQVRATGRLRG